MSQFPIIIVYPKSFYCPNHVAWIAQGFECRPDLKVVVVGAVDGALPEAAGLGDTVRHDGRGVWELQRCRNAGWKAWSVSISLRNKKFFVAHAPQKYVLKELLRRGFSISQFVLRSASFLLRQRQQRRRFLLSSRATLWRRLTFDVLNEWITGGVLCIQSGPDEMQISTGMDKKGVPRGSVNPDTGWRNLGTITVCLILQSNNGNKTLKLA